MKHFIIILLSLAIPSAHAYDVAKKLNVYLRGDIGGAWTSWGYSEIHLPSTVRTNYFYGMGGGAVGYKFNDMIRVDVNGQTRAFQYSARNQAVSFSQRVRNYSMFTNIYITVPTDVVFSPYLTAGIGFSHNSTGNISPLPGDLSTIGQYTKNFSWNVGTGLIMKMYKNIDIDIAYRYLDLGPSKTQYSPSATPTDLKLDLQNMKTHQVNLGVIFNF